MEAEAVKKFLTKIEAEAEAMKIFFYKIEAEAEAPSRSTASKTLFVTFRFIHMLFYFYSWLNRPIWKNILDSICPSFFFDWE